MKFYCALFLICSLTLGCAQSKSKPITEFSQNDTNAGMLLDVRTSKEYSEGHLDNAVNLDWFAKDFVKRCKLLDRNKLVYVYCKKGGRSAKAAHILDSLGFKNVVDLEGGYDAFIARERN